ncbi:MAG TPA: substrate-binding domain-containing protein, partial [Nitrolancea sp.]|nr:substrate-binding domain-containing protein [Nitrolancea sp.]
MITHGLPNDPFWTIIQRGAHDAAKDFNVKLSYEQLTGSSVDPGQEARLLSAALVQNPQGIAVTIPDPHALGGPIKQALAKNIPLIAFNSGDNDYTKLGVQTYVGFDQTKTGQVAAQQMLARNAKDDICINHQQG